jgi:hypothetical protein
MFNYYFPILDRNKLMKTIFVINQNTLAGEMAHCAIEIAALTGAKILFGVERISASQTTFVASTGTELSEEESLPDSGMKMIRRPRMMSQIRESYQPSIEQVDISAMNVDALANYINTNNIQLIIKSPSKSPAESAEKTLNWQSVLNKILIPILVIPENGSYRPIKNFSYVTDLRYCRQDVMRYVSKLTDSLDASLFLAHLTSSGLPDLMPDFAVSIFEEVAKKWPDKNKLIMHHVRETDILRVADVLINGMNTDALILVNHSAHYDRLIGNDLSLRYPGITLNPILLFPN